MAFASVTAIGCKMSLYQQQFKYNVELMRNGCTTIRNSIASFNRFRFGFVRRKRRLLAAGDIGLGLLRTGRRCFPVAAGDIGDV